MADKLDKFSNKLKEFANIGNSVSNYVGYKAAEHLWDNYLSGQRINYKGKYDKSGRRKYSYSVKNINKVTIKSYPLNIWEKGYVSKLGKVVPGRYILREFKRDVSINKLSNWTKEAIEYNLAKVFRS